MSDADDAALPFHPRQVMAPGWWWKLLDASEAGAAWTAFTRSHPAVKTRKTVATGQGTAAEKGSWVLFEVTGTEPVLWTLPGLPSKAPRGAATEYSDIVASPEPEPSGTDLLESAFDNLRAPLVWGGPVLLWGGIGLLLWQTAQLLRRPSR